MSEFSWGPEAAEDTRPEEQPGEPGTLSLSAHDFAALEDRVLRAVNLVKRERLERTQAEERAARAEAKLAEHSQSTQELEKEIGALRAERDHVRQRVERLLSQLDALEL